MSRFGAAILGCEGLRVTPEEKTFFAEYNPFGFILFARNIDTLEQVRALTSDLWEAVGWNAPVFIDQEGGRVQRYRAPLGQEWLPPLDEVARFGPMAPRAMYLRSALIAAELRAMGIDGNCVPTLDVAREDTHPVLKNRLYGSDLQAIVDVGLSVAQGQLAQGVLPVIKHMPGHGLARVDSHLDLPRVTADAETLQALDFKVFQSFTELPLGMSAHLVFEAFDDQNPATISRVMIDLIRNQIGFDGFLMTDDISMEALSGTVATRGAAALAAGCDAVLHCNGDLGEMRALMDTIGHLGDAGQARAEAALRWRLDAPTLDTEALQAEFEALLRETHA